MSKLRIAIDLTPLYPGGNNGGAKVFVLHLLVQLQQSAPHFQFLLLTSPWNHQELLNYENQNTQCLLLTDLVDNNNSFGYIDKLTNLWKKIKFKLARLTYLSSLLKQHKINLLFCPFSAPRFIEKEIPSVGIVHDLQHLDYPEFFPIIEQKLRTKFIKSLIHKSQKIICVSEFSRQSLIEHFHPSPQQLVVIPTSIQSRWYGLSEEITNEYLLKLGLLHRSYAFYPANYWQHKNHRFLLESYKIYRNKAPNSPLDLVFTGDLKQEEHKLRQEAMTLNISDYVHFLGFLDEKYLEAVWRGCQCLVFPSLYEGFGIPILEAMYFRKPVLCSNAASLPEVGGNAVLYFNPNISEELVNGLLRISHDANLAAELVQKGQERLKIFDVQEMVKKYIMIFESVVSAGKR